MRYLWRVLLEALGGLVPVCTDSLRCQFNFLVTLVYYLAQPEICDLDFAIVKNDVLRLQVIVNDFLLAIVKILESTQNLAYDKFSFLLVNLPVLF